MPFRDPNQPRDLLARLDAEVRERLEEAVDYVCLDAMVQRRRARGLPAPAADSPGDREEFEGGVLAFLGRLRAELLRDVDAPLRRKAQEAVPRPDDASVAELLAVQAVLAKALPDYWQRFEEISLRFLGDAGAPADPSSRGERRGFLGRLFG